MFAGMVERRSWLSKLLDSLTLMKGDERVKLLEEGADFLLLGNFWHKNPLFQKMDRIQLIGRVSRRGNCLRKNGSHYPLKLDCIFPVGVIITNFMAIYWEKFGNNTITDIVSNKSTELKIGVRMPFERDITLTHDVSSCIDVVGLNRFWVLKKHPRDGNPMLPSEGSVVTLIDPKEFVPQLTLFPSCCESPAASSYLSFLHHLSRHLLMIGNSVSWGKWLMSAAGKTTSI